MIHTDEHNGNVESDASCASQQLVIIFDHHKNFGYHSLNRGDYAEKHKSVTKISSAENSGDFLYLLASHSKAKAMKHSQSIRMNYGPIGNVLQVCPKANVELY